MGGDGVWEEDVILVHVLVGGGLLSNLTPITGQPASHGAQAQAQFCLDQVEKKSEGVFAQPKRGRWSKTKIEALEQHQSLEAGQRPSVIQRQPTLSPCCIRSVP